MRAGLTRSMETRTNEGNLTHGSPVVQEGRTPELATLTRRASEGGVRIDDDSPSLTRRVNVQGLAAPFTTRKKARLRLLLCPLRHGKGLGEVGDRIAPLV